MAKDKEKKPNPIKIERSVDIPVADIEFNDWNPNEMDDNEFSALLEEIEEEGFDDPVKVVETAPGKFLVVDGEHRLRAAKALGATELPCIVKTWDEVTQMIKTVRRNNIRGTHNEQKLDSLIVRIAKKGEQDAERLAAAMVIGDEDIVRNALAYEDREARNMRLTVDNDEVKAEADKAKKASAKAIAKQAANLVTELLDEAEETAEKNFMVFAHRGQKHCIVQASPSLVKRLEKMKKALILHDMEINEFMCDAIDEGLLKLGK